MDQRTITKEISNDDLCAALELLYRSMGIIKPSEEMGDATFSRGPILVTFTLKTIATEQGVENISFR